MSKKQKTNIIIELILIFIITLLFNIIHNEITHDEIWNYGFSYNIAKGLVPYKDFNMIVPPFSPIISAVFMIIFGKNIIIYYVFNSLICTLLFYNIKKTVPKAYYIIYMVMLYFGLTAPNYNLICLLLTYIIINLEKEEKKDYLIGILLGLLFITKQSIGICLCLPTLLIKDKKKIIKRIIGFIIVNTILLIYLLYNNSLFEFIDYCFLGMIDFGKKNTYNHPVFTIVVIANIINLIKEYIIHKDITILYMIAIYSMTYPIFDVYHVGIPSMITLGYFLNKLKLNKKIISCSFLLFIISITVYNIYEYNNNVFTYPNNTNSYKYRRINNNVVTGINLFSEYLNENKQNTFIIDSYAYLIKINTNIPISKFDLLNDGNMGKNGQYKIINAFNNICQKNKCTFLLNKELITSAKYTQQNKEILQYIVNNYTEDGNILGLTIYKNK